MQTNAATMARTGAAKVAPAIAELAQSIRQQLGPASARRVGSTHAAVLRTLMDMEETSPDVNAIYRALLVDGQPMVMSKLYRVLKVLEEARMIERHWTAHHEGRPRSIYCVAGRARPGGHEHESGVCRFCGVTLHD